MSTGPDDAQVRIQYGTNGRPDLYIRPWPGGDNWQSPDIEVRNARSAMDPAHWFNTPWIGHANTVVARYRNRGPVTCRNVKVDLFVKDYTVGGGPEAFLGSATHDVPPESITPFVEFEANWIPPNDGHRCIIARTPLFLDTSVNPTLVELSDSNNMAQSNYTQYIAAAASPAKRGIAEVTLEQPVPGAGLDLRHAADPRTVRRVLPVVPRARVVDARPGRFGQGEGDARVDVRRSELRWRQALARQVLLRADPRVAGRLRRQP